MEEKLSSNDITLNIDIQNKTSNEQKPSFKERVKSFYKNVFSSPYKVVLYTGGFLFVLMLIYFLVLYFLFHNFYCACSDDIAQYYPIMVNFITDLKSGNLSWYSFKNYLGSSLFSDAYYVPIDIFTLLILILSTFMRVEVAMSFVELIKLIAGAMAISLYMAMKGTKPKWVHLIGMLYFASSGITCFSCFPGFTALAFYIPFSLVIARLFIKKGWWWVVPLYSMLVVFYNFYLDYMVFAFMAFSILFITILEAKKWYKVIGDTILYVLLILFGLLMAMCIFLPSILFILNSTTRNVVEMGESSSLVKMVNMFKSYIDIIITFFSSVGLLVKNIFTENVTFFHNNIYFSNSFIQLRHLVRSLSPSGSVGGYFEGLNRASLFSIEEFFRVMGSLYTPSVPLAFVGYQKSYFIEHISLYITGFGLLISSYVWCLKDRESRIYRIMNVVILVFLSLPFFSYIFSADLEVLYTRWMNVIPVVMLVVAGHVLDETDLYKMKSKHMIFLSVILIVFGLFASYHHLDNMRIIANKNNWSAELVSTYNLWFTLALILMGLVFLFLMSMFIVGKQNNKKKKVLYPLCTTIFVGGIITILAILINNLENLPSTVYNNLSFYTPALHNQSIAYDLDYFLLIQYVSIFTLIAIMVGIFAIASKKKKIIITIIALECLLSACFSFGTPVDIYNVESKSGFRESFQKTEELSDIIKENIGETDIYRIYIDESISGVQRTNISRFMPTGTNSEVFHSFYNSETDNVAHYLIPRTSAVETQAGKTALNTYSYYLNIVLGYKYVVTSATLDFDKSIFRNVYQDDNYLILEFKDYIPFMSFGSYTASDTYESFMTSLVSVSERAKFMTQYIIVDKDQYEEAYKYLGDEDESAPDFSSSSTPIYNSTYSKATYINSTTIDTKTYYRYQLNNTADTRSYALNISAFGGITSDELKEMVQNKGLFVEYSNGEIIYLTDGNIRSMNGSIIHLPVYGNSPTEASTPLSDSSWETINLGSDGGERAYPKYFGVDSSKVKTSTNIMYIFEAIMDTNNMADYEQYNPSINSSVDSFFRYTLNTEVDETSGLISIASSNDSFNVSSIIVEYEDGTFSFVQSEFKPQAKIKYIYLRKGNGAGLTTIPNISVYESASDMVYSDSLINKEIVVKKSKIMMTYTNTSPKDGYNIIMLPIAYSTEWKMSGDGIKMLKVDGGFVGIVVPTNKTNISIQLQFVPVGLSKGVSISLAAIYIYLILLGGWILIKIIKKRSRKWQNSQF